MNTRVDARCLFGSLVCKAKATDWGEPTRWRTISRMFAHSSARMCEARSPLEGQSCPGSLQHQALDPPRNLRDGVFF